MAAKKKPLTVSQRQGNHRNKRLQAGHTQVTVRVWVKAKDKEKATKRMRASVEDLEVKL